MDPMRFSNGKAKFYNPNSYEITATLYFEPTTLSLNLTFLSEHFGLHFIAITVNRRSSLPASANLRCRVNMALMRFYC
jgi:hypothetical protein